MSEIEVNPYSRYAGSFINIGKYAYNLKSIPNEIMLIGNSINIDTEKVFIDLINKNDKKQIIEMMKCISEEFKELPFKINDFSYSKLLAGQGMEEKEDPKYYNPCVVVMNMGSDIELVLFDEKMRKQYPVMIPQRTMFLLEDKGFKFKRVIAKKQVDKVGQEENVRSDRYSFVFKSRK